MRERPVVSREAQEIGRDPDRVGARGRARGGGLYLARPLHRTAGARELDVTARRAIGLAEARLVMVTEALDDLAARGVRSCAGADLDAMHETSFRIVPIKELSVVEPAGDTRCTNLAIPLGAAQRDRARSRIPAHDITIDDHPARRPQRRLRAHPPRHRGRIGARRADARRHHAAADIVERRPACDRRDAGGGATAPFSASGTPRAPSPRTPGETLTAQVQSRHFGMVVTTSMPRARVLAGHRDSIAMATAGTGGGSR